MAHKKTKNKIEEILVLIDQEEDWDLRWMDC